MTDGSAGTCFGFAVRSALPFHYLREGGGDPLDVVSGAGAGDHGDRGNGELLLEWTPSPRFPLAGRLVRAEPGFRLWVDTWGWFLVDPQARRVSMPETDNVVRREERLWSIPAMLCLLARGDSPLHAAAVEIDGHAVVLAAPGTHGKTTLAAALHAAGHRLLSEDTTCVRVAEAAAVVPGPAMLRLRHDVARHVAVPNAVAVGSVQDDRVHLALDPAVRGDCAAVPLHAIVLLRRSDEQPRIERATPAEAVRDLWALSFRLPTDEDRERCFAAVTDIARTVPIWNLHRPLRFSDLPATVALVAAHA